jgi:predicted DNA-binding transcriptional regulator AlpA
MRAATNPVSHQAERILTAIEIAAELRCSKAQVYRLMNGKVAGLTPLPTLRLGRKKVVMRASFEAWKLVNERNRVIVPSDSEVDAVDAIA